MLRALVCLSDPSVRLPVWTSPRLDVSCLSVCHTCACACVFRRAKEEMARRKAEERARREEGAQRQAEEEKKTREEEERRAEEERAQQEKEEANRHQKQVRGMEKPAHTHTHTHTL